MERPHDIQQLASVIDRLVTCGGARVPESIAPYLRYIGVAVGNDHDEWMWPTPSFIERALPANDTSDLLRRAAIRDPQYRLHVDLLMCSVIHAVAGSERWQRLEDLLFGQCLPIAPRLLQLMSWISAATGEHIRTIHSTRIRETIQANADPVFGKWDDRLWGESRAAADLFPLLLDLYVPLNGQPIYVMPTLTLNYELLASLISAAWEAESLIFSADQLDDVKALQSHGLPLRCGLHYDRRVHVALIGAVELEYQPKGSRGELRDAHRVVTNSARMSQMISQQSVCPKWSAAENIELFAPTSIGTEESRWPNQTLPDAPPWHQLPGSDVISTAAKRRKDSQDADAALLEIAKHPLYGFLLQLFLLEALDRELGEETLALALPQNRKLESVDDWADTSVLYRPRDESRSGELAGSDRFLVLGSLDDVIPIVGRELGIKGIATPYRSTDMPWSRAVYLMSTAGIVDGRPQNWRLTITTFILDRLHSGTLMKDVIRGGRRFRDQMHMVLSELWKQKTKMDAQEQIPA